MIVDGQKLACLPCIRGHRVSNCQHTNRELLKVRPKGRPSTQCSKCRELRRTRKAHVKCICAELKADNAEGDAEPALKIRRTEEDKVNSKVSSIESLLNPCHCKQNDRFCTCCKSEFSEFLTRTYPTRVVEQTAKTLTSTLKHTTSASEPVTPAVASRSGSTRAACPSGPNAPCCKSDLDNIAELPAIKSATVQQRPMLPMPRQHRRLQPPATQQRLPSLWNGPMHQLPIPPRQTMAMHQQQQPATAGQAERPSCSCGCDCSKKLDMLIQAIEARIGLGPPLAPTRTEPEWVRSVLSPMTAGPARARTSHVRTPSVGSLTRPLVPSSAPQTARRTSFGQPQLPATQSRQRSVSASSASTSGKEHPSTIRRQESFAAGVVPPATWQQPSLPTSVCGKSQVSLPQQTLPTKSCCDGKERPANGKCAAHCSGDCACCKQPKWVPGNAQNATVDADGALSCSCGCHKPFGECSDCIKDKCMGLYESNV
ncbi:copper-binding transcription factor [Coemansia sp. RSA 2336]|nr:copper-binding transcription factor [Coemansia sp. RSA 2336]